jgi:hypothetical protein
MRVITICSVEVRCLQNPLRPLEPAGDCSGSVRHARVAPLAARSAQAYSVGDFVNLTSVILVPVEFDVSVTIRI